MSAPTLKLLGAMELSGEGGPLALPPSKKTRALLGFLALEPGDHTRRRLCDLLWDGPADPRAALRWSLSKLRPLVDGEQTGIVADREHVRLREGTLQVDVLGLAERLRGPIADMDTTHLEDCERCFRGEVLEGLDLDDCFSYEQWLEAKREKARNLHVLVLSALTSRDHEDPAHGLEHARAWAATDPLDAAAHARVIEWLGRLGRPDSARRAAESCRELFRRELGRDPGPAVERSLRAVFEVEVPPAETRVPVESTVDIAPRDVGLFGRADECVELERQLEPTEEGARVLWIEGEPGIGKSRLLRELLDRAAKRGFHTVYAKAYEAERARPFALLSEALGQPAESARSRIYESLAGHLTTPDGSNSTLLALDDLQWIDESSAAFLSWFARRSTVGQRIAAAVRPGELEDNPAAQRLLRDLERDNIVRRVPLEPLEAAEVRALVRSVDAGVDANSIVESCGGNPLFAIELARGGIHSQTRLRSCVSERLERLGEAEREVLRVGAALGRSFSLDLVSEVTDLRTGEVLRAIDTLERRGFVRMQSGEGVDFSHDVLRQAVYDELSGPARKLLHRRIARTLAADDRSRALLAPLLARQAQLGGEHELAAVAFAESGEGSLRLHAAEEATEFARRGLRQAVLLEPSRQRALRARLLTIEVHAGLGRREPEVLYEEIATLGEAARRLAEHETVRTALYLMSVLDEESGRFGRAEERTMAAVEAGRSATPETQVRALANSGRCLAQLERELDRADEFLAEAEQRGGPRAAVVDTAWGRGLIAWHRGDLEHAAMKLSAAFDGASELENHWASFECLSRLALVEIEAGNPASALARAESLRSAARRLAGGSEQALAESIVELALYAQDEAADGSRLESAFTALREMDSKAALSMVLNIAARLDLTRGRRPTAHSWASEAHGAALAVGREHQLDRARALLDALSNDRSTRED